MDTVRNRQKHPGYYHNVIDEHTARLQGKGGSWSTVGQRRENPGNPYDVSGYMGTARNRLEHKWNLYDVSGDVDMTRYVL